MTVRSHPTIKTLIAALSLAATSSLAQQQQPPAPPTAGPSLTPVMPAPGNITIKRPSSGVVGQPGPGIEDRAAPPEVEAPPVQAARPAMPGQAALPMPDEGEEQEAIKPVHPGKQCPKTLVLKAPPPTSATAHSPDFPSTPGPAWIESNFGGTTPDRHFRHTFHFGDTCKGKCCEFQKGKLVVTVKALLSGHTQQSPDAGNDSISIWKNGSLQHWQYIHSGPVAAGTTKTLTLPVQAAWLDGCRLSFQVQDDHSVLDARLVLTGCCVTPNIKP